MSPMAVRPLFVRSKLPKLSSVPAGTALGLIVTVGDSLDRPRWIDMTCWILHVRPSPGSRPPGHFGLSP